MQSIIPPPFQHKWTENQVSILLHKINCSPPLQQLFFLKLGDNSPESIRLEQRLCLDVLKDTDWMGFMIRDRRVFRDTSGRLVVRDQWPKSLRVVSRLFEELHPLAEKIKLSLGPVKTSQSLRKGSVEHTLWRKWQNQSKHTWYFKYVAIRITLSSKWIYQRPTSGDSQLGREVESSLIGSPNQKTKVNELASDVKHHSAKVNPNLIAVSSVRLRPRLNMDKILARVEGRPPTTINAPKAKMTDEASIDPSHPQFVTSPSDGHETHSRASSPEIYHSINDISVEPPMELHQFLITSTDTDTTLVHSSKSSDRHMQEKTQIGISSEQDRLLISALLDLLTQEREHVRSKCMADLLVIHDAPLQSHEEAILHLLRQMGGETRESGDEVEKGNIMDQGSDKQRYRLVSELPAEKEGVVEDDYSPVTLVELVGVMKECRRRELEEKSVDLLTF